MRSLTKVAIGCGAGLALLGAVPATLLAAADSGVLNAALIGLIQAKTRRTIRVHRLKLHLLSNDPSIQMSDLVVGSPPGTTTDPVARIGAATLHLNLAPLLLGRLQLTDVALAGVDLHLARLGPGHNNYSFGGAGLSATFASVRRLSLVNGHVDYDDPQRGITLAGPVAYSATNGGLPLHLTGGGVLRGQPYRVSADGAQLNGRGAHDDYRFQASAEDGETKLHFAGVSQKPFDFRGFDLAVKASGPNLADLGYLFNIDAPNSPPFTLAAQVRRNGRVVTLRGVKALIGASDLAGDLTSDHSGPRRRLTVRLVSTNLRASDIAILAAPRPDHASARSKPGQPAPPVKADGWSAKPFDFSGMRKLDATLDLTAANVTGYVVGLHQVVGRLTLEQGRLEINPFSASLAPGGLTGQLAVDGRSDDPTLQMSAAVRGARIGALRPSAARTVDGDLDMTFTGRSTGGSARSLAAHAAGRFAVRVQHGRIQRSKAEAIGGDPLQAAWLAWADKGASTPLTCVSMAFNLKDGVATPSLFFIDTPAGVAVGHGEVNLATEQVDLLLQPQAFKRPSVTGPVRITGALTHPTASVDAKQAVKRAGLGAVVALASTPFRALAAPPVAAAVPSACPLGGEGRPSGRPTD